MNNIFIIYVNYNSAEEIFSAIERVNKQKSNLVCCKVIVIDNSGELASHKYFDYMSNVVLINSGANLGYCGGNNLAYSYILDRHLEGDILVCNPDTTFDVKQLEIINKTVSHWGVYTLPACNQNGKVLYTKVKLSGFNQQIFTGRHSDVFVDTDYCPGSFLYFRRSKFENIPELFDERFFMYWEEVDLSLTIRKKGGKCCFINNAGHILRKDNKKGWLNNAVYYYFRNSFLIRHKHKDIFSCINIFKFFSKSILVFTIKSAAQYNFQIIKMMCYGICDGLRNKFGKK